MGKMNDIVDDNAVAVSMWWDNPLALKRLLDYLSEYK